MGYNKLGLIPKVAYPESITQFRPISLCNTLYKLLSRIIVQRLKPYIAEVINPCQVGFMLRCRTSDNIILVQDVIWTLKSRRDRNGYVAIKSDLEKAYNRLEWSFIQETLEFFQLPPTFITFIMNMISSTRFHILWNGTPLPKVVPSMGVRQGDPLSAYLFILCLELLSIKLEEAKAKDCKNLRRILQHFYESSGQLMSVTKSRLWFFPSTPRRTKEQVAGMFGIPTTDHIGMYLGTPIFTTRRTAQSYQYLVDKI